MSNKNNDKNNNSNKLLIESPVLYFNASPETKKMLKELYELKTPDCFKKNLSDIIKLSDLDDFVLDGDANNKKNKIIKINSLDKDFIDFLKINGLNI